MVIYPAKNIEAKKNELYQEELKKMSKMARESEELEKKIFKKIVFIYLLPSLLTTLPSSQISLKKNVSYFF